MAERGRILVVTYYLPPKSHIASQRTGGLCKYLSSSDWDVVVLTADHPAEFESPYDVISVDFDDPLLSRLINWYKRSIRPIFSNQENSPSVQSSVESTNSQNLIERVFGPAVHLIRDEFIHYPDNKRLWEDEAVEVGKNYISDHEVSCIISSSGPFTSHRIASRLSIQHDLPWIADYRDRWSQNPYENHTHIRELFERRMEKETIKPASEIVTVSDPIAKDLSNFYERDVNTITHGYDKDRFPDRDLNDQFTILYPGQFYREKRDPEMLFASVSRLLGDKIPTDDLQIEFYGYAQPWVMELADQYGILDSIVNHDFVPQKEILKRERESHCLLSLHWNDSRAEGVYTGKIFEYLGAGRPIAAINPPKVVDQLLAETGAGKSFYKEYKLEEWIYDQYATFQETGKVKYDVDTEAVEKYSQQRMAEKFENIIIENISE
ncbi:hypothetical protein [Halobacterium salinarum]|uniref:hypothetical protein n=1 Tax=Halobacterium salinarum TaxID=2242 RepID=UPI002556E445|nr:hypothetical protein [Halobacterium salinarum]MDL0141622.1 hypothetical protein [Halobacterium salinarum]